ncbi:hypothetical protein ACJX0J_008130, partial [Zea mays]
MALSLCCRFPRWLVHLHATDCLFRFIVSEATDLLCSAYNLIIVYYLVLHFHLAVYDLLILGQYIFIVSELVIEPILNMLCLNLDDLETYRTIGSWKGHPKTLIHYFLVD